MSAISYPFPFSSLASGSLDPKRLAAEVRAVFGNKCAAVSFNNLDPKRFYVHFEDELDEAERGELLRILGKHEGDPAQPEATSAN